MTEPSGALLNDRIPNCILAACYHAMQVWDVGNKDIAEPEIERTFRRRCHKWGCYIQTVLWLWLVFEMAGFRLGSFCRIKTKEYPKIVRAWRKTGALLVLTDEIDGIKEHAILAFDITHVRMRYISAGKVYDDKDMYMVLKNATYVMAISPHFEPLFIWWAIKRNPLWAVLGGLLFTGLIAWSLS